MNQVTGVGRRPSCLRHPMARHNRLDSIPSQMHSLSLLQMAMFQLLVRGLPRKTLPLQPLLRKHLSQNWDTGDVSYPPTPFERLAPSGCIVRMVRYESASVEMQKSCVY